MTTVAEVYAKLLSRAPENKIEPRLDPVRRATELLGDPHLAYPVIHITGTNGKTSTARMIEAILREHHLRTGRFTSPHLHSVTERISIGGEPVSEETFTRVWEEVEPYLQIVDAELVVKGENPLTYFEALTVLGFAIFADTPVDVAIVEVGLGGTWDSTNIVQSQVAVITPIDLDHTELLGDTVELIAEEKSGIIKPSSLIVSATQEESAWEVLSGKAASVQTSGVVEGTHFGVLQRTPAVGGQMLHIKGPQGDYPELFLPLYGNHQAQNAAVALAACEMFLGGGDQPLKQDIVEAALRGVSSPGRAELVRSTPPMVVDAGHNPAGMRVLKETVEESFQFSPCIGLVGALYGKDVEGMLDVMETFMDEIVVTASTSERSIPAEELADLAVEIFGSDRVHCVPRLDNAIDKAIEFCDLAYANQLNASSNQTFSHDDPTRLRGDQLLSLDGSNAGIIATGSVTIAAEVKLLMRS